MRTILIIDDHNDIRENIAEILTLSGYKAITAENGKKGIEAAMKEKPDLVICDIMMPELDGYGVLHLLRRNEETALLPFIFLSAKAERSDMRKGMDMGADDYIMKPFDDIELLNAVETRLKKYDILHEKYAPGEQGATELIKKLNGSGLLDIDMSRYDSTRLAKKQVVYNEGKRPRFLYYVTEGKIKTYRIHEDGKEYITNLYTTGDFMGYLPLLEDNLYDETAEILEDAELLLIPKDEFLNVLYKDITIASTFIKLIAQNVKDKEERLMQLAYGSLRKRVAKALLDIYNKFNVEGRNANKQINISREDIAQYVGTATESLIRTISDFKSEKLIETVEGKIRIINLEKLQHLLY
ncbi:MAG TPA: response regulator [Chitinophagaceae bacterium]|nr:response regulator [Chitinophagaceae bacterium]